jgi:predicted secreted protein
LRPTADPVVNLTEQDNRVEAPVGLYEKLLISLPVRKGSGAVWQLTDPVGPQLEQLRAPAAKPGTQVLAFHAVKTGTVTVRLSTSTGGNWYAVILVWEIQLSPKNFGRPGPGVTSPR